MSTTTAPGRSASQDVAVSLLKFYKSNRSLLLNTSYIILLTAAFTGATDTRAKKDDSNERDDEGDPSASELGEHEIVTQIESNHLKKHPKLSKDAFWRLIKAAVPSGSNSAVFHLVTHLVLLVVRAMITIKVANLDGKLVGALVSKRLKRFAKLLLFWMMIGFPAAFVNGSLEWTKQKLRQSLRRNLDTSIINDYLPDNLDPNYYSLIHLSGNKIKDPNQRITTDISRLSFALSNLPGQLLKPTLDLLLCARELSKSGVGNGEGTLLLGMLAHFSTMVLRFFSPPFAKLASEKANLEGQLRSSHSKIVSNSEEIALLRGHERELNYIDYCYYNLERFLKNEYWKRAIHEIAQTFIVKYLWGAAGLVLCSAPIFITKYLGLKPNPNHAGEFITNRRLLMSASDSLDRLIYSRKFILSFIGHALRVSEFQDIMCELKRKKNNDQNIVFDNDQITFDNVKLLTPADVTLIESLNFSIKSGDHLLIAGPNGCGKSSMFRMLGGLWPCKHGTITIPNSKNMFYIPQRAYMSQGSLKEQIVYPHNLEHYKKQSKTDEDLKQILTILKLTDYVDMLDVTKNWNEELSIGAQQRLAMARLYYHQPKFAVLDECTSAVSPDMEQFMYKHAQELGITVLSVAHRSALWHFHKYLLKFDGKGGYHFGPLDANRRLKLENERIVLEKTLRDLPALKERLSELQKVSNAQHKRHDK